jgi:hypothetical protein
MSLKDKEIKERKRCGPKCPPKPDDDDELQQNRPSYEQQAHNSLWTQQ